MQASLSSSDWLKQLTTIIWTSLIIFSILIIYQFSQLDNKLGELKQSAVENTLAMQSMNDNQEENILFVVKKPCAPTLFEKNKNNKESDKGILCNQMSLGETRNCIKLSMIDFFDKDKIMDKENTTLREVCTLYNSQKEDMMSRLQNVVNSEDRQKMIEMLNLTYVICSVVEEDEIELGTNQLTPALGMISNED